MFLFESMSYDPKGLSKEGKYDFNSNDDSDFWHSFDKPGLFVDNEQNTSLLCNEVLIHHLCTNPLVELCQISLQKMKQNSMSSKINDAFYFLEKTCAGEMPFGTPEFTLKVVQLH